MRQIASLVRTGTPVLNFVRTDVFLLFLLFIGNYLLRLPGYFQELPPYTFCDEDIFLGPAFSMLSEKNWVPPHLLSGAVNFYLPIALADVVRFFTGESITSGRFTLISRLLGTGVLSSLVPILLYLIGKKCLKSTLIGWIAALTYTISPMALGISRIFYPDHYISFFSAAIILWANRLLDKSSIKKIAFDTVGIGALLAVAMSAKLIAAVLVLTVALILILESVSHGKDEFLPFAFRTATVLMALICVALFLFAIINRLDINFDKFMEGVAFNRKHYANGHPGMESNQGIVWYARAYFFTSLGIAAGTAAISGIIFGIIKKERWIISLGCTVACYIIYMGSQRTIINRNLMIVLPIVFIFIGYCAKVVVDFARSRNIKIHKMSWIVIGLVFLLEPLYKTTASLANDFQSDSRQAAAGWIKENLQKDNVTYGFASACWGNPFPPDFSFQRVNYFSPPDLDKPFDYFVLDSWLFDHFGPGTDMQLMPVYSEMIFSNPTEYYPIDHRAKMVKYLQRYVLVKEFSKKDYYGPTIWIYQKK